MTPNIDTPAKDDAEQFADIYQQMWQGVDLPAFPSSADVSPAPSEQGDSSSEAEQTESVGKPITVEEPDCTPEGTKLSPGAEKWEDVPLTPITGQIMFSFDRAVHKDIYPFEPSDDEKEVSLKASKSEKVLATADLKTPEEEQPATQAKDKKKAKKTKKSIHHGSKSSHGSSSPTSSSGESGYDFYGGGINFSDARLENIGQEHDEENKEMMSSSEASSSAPESNPQASSDSIVKKNNDLVSLSEIEAGLPFPFPSLDLSTLPWDMLSEIFSSLSNLPTTLLIAVLMMLFLWRSPLNATIAFALLITGIHYLVRSSAGAGSSCPNCSNKNADATAAIAVIAATAAADDDLPDRPRWARPQVAWNMVFDAAAFVVTTKVVSAGKPAWVEGAVAVVGLMWFSKNC